MNRLAKTLAPLALVLLAGCNEQELYSKQTERSANEMVAALRQAGLKADKKGAEGGFAVITSSNDFSRAMQVLETRGLPRAAYDSLGKVFKPNGFVSTPLEERARWVHATSEELSNTLATIDGVITARVHLVMPERNPLVDKVRPSAASVLIKHRADKDLSALTSQIKALVVNGIEGLAYDNVTVALVPAETPRVEAAKPTPPEQKSTLGLPFESPLLAFGMFGAIACGSGSFLLWFRRRAPVAPRRLTDKR